MLEIFKSFFILGCTGFGGPVATMAMMEREFCARRRWVSPGRFQELYAICKILPGPVATQLALAIGRERRGIKGGAVAGIAFILPCFALLLIFAHAYQAWGWAQSFSAWFHGMQIGALVVMVISLLRFAQGQPKRAIFWMAMLSSAGAVIWNPALEPALIIGWGVVYAYRFSLYQWIQGRLSQRKLRSVGFWGTGLEQPALALFWLCFKAGAVIFGSGLAIIPLLEGEVVSRRHWLTHAQFMDGLALGQVTPGPVVMTVTFIGYLVMGWGGAILATLGVFIPSFINVLILLPRLWERLGKSPRFRSFIEAAIPAVIGGILGSLLRLAGPVLNAPFAPGWPVWVAWVGFGLLLFSIRIREFPLWSYIIVVAVISQIANG